MASMHVSWPTLLSVFFCFGAVSGALFAVDLGSEYVKVALIKPGRVPIAVVHNELSKRKTPTAVAFQKQTRLYGEDALALTTKTPRRVFLRIRDFLGRNAADPMLQELFGADPRWKPPYTFLPSEEEGTVRFDIGDEESLTTEEILASLFSYLKAMTKEEAGEEVMDCVIAVPAFFGPVQKRRILDVAKLAEINVLAIVNGHGAAALQYGIERDFVPTPKTVLIYDMGANTVQASLVSFSGYERLDRGKSVMVGQFKVLDVQWNENLGGDHLDWALVHHFAARFNEKFGVDLYTSQRAMSKLKTAAGKTKHVLSANSEAHIHVEELFEGQDFNDKIKRTEFEEMNKAFFAKAIEPLTKLLGRNSVNVSDLEAVELIGGGSRVPKLQTVLSEALGNRPLDKHLDGDEAIVMGAGLVAANLSTIFRLRKFGYLDGIIYPMQLQVLEPENWKPEHDVAMLLRPKSLLPYQKQLPSKRIVNLHNVSNTDEIQFQIKFNVTEEHPLPPGSKDDLYATYTISGLTNAVKKVGEGGKIVLHFVTDLSGLLDVDHAEYVVEEIEAPPAEAPAPESAAPVTESPTVEAGNETTAAENVTKAAKDSPVPKKRTRKVVLTVSEAEYVHPSMTAKQLKASRAVLKKYTKGETLKKATEQAKNTLESYVVESQNKIRDTYEVQEVTTAAQREEFLTELTSVEDWLYMDGADASTEHFEGKLKELQKLGDPIFARAAESVNRPLSVEQCKKNIDIIQKTLNTAPEMKPWLVDDLIELANETYSLQKWLVEKEEEQSQLEPHETPAFTSIEVLQRLLRVEKVMKRILNKKPPKPTPPPTNETQGSNETAPTTTPDSDETEGDKAGAAEGEAAAEAGHNQESVEELLIDNDIEQHIEL